MDINARFGKALRRLRKYKQLSQEDFSDVSSRTYVSSLERGMKSPTLEKIDALAQALEVDPLLLLVLTLAEQEPDQLRLRLQKVLDEIEQVPEV